MNRREFLRGTLVALPVAYITACGSAGSDYSGGNGGGQQQNGNPSCSNGGGVTYTNPTHPHTTIALTAAQVATASPGNYMLLGGTHNHTFTLNAGDFATLKTGAIVSGKMDLEGHGHLIDIICT